MKVASLIRISRTLAISAGALLALVGGPAMSGASHSQAVYQLGGNFFIIRRWETPRRIYLQAFRKAGDQWEHFSQTSLSHADAKRFRASGGYNGIVTKIYFAGRKVGTTLVDLDNPLNTSLNKNAPIR